MSMIEKERIQKLKELGIEVDVFDADEPYDEQREKDVSEATLLILEEKSIPEDLMRRLLAYKERRERLPSKVKSADAQD